MTNKVGKQMWLYNHQQGRLCKVCDAPICDKNKSGVCIRCLSGCRTRTGLGKFSEEDWGLVTELYRRFEEQAIRREIRGREI